MYSPFETTRRRHRRREVLGLGVVRASHFASWSSLSRVWSSSQFRGFLQSFDPACRCPLTCGGSRARPALVRARSDAERTDAQAGRYALA